MAKPFSIQSPEDIAKEYAGNKQKIAEAMQLGVVDPTAGVLAGMFIDRMRSAQMQEQAPQGTVAQQVMGGAPPAPPTAPAGGLGATPQAAPPMAPEMGMPPEMGMAPPQGEAPMGMAEGGMVPPYAAGGGLSDAPIPDGMFDEPSNGGFGDGYAGGGLVAFAGGSPGELKDPSDYGAYIERTAQGLYPNLRVAGRGRTPARNAQVGGVANSYHLIDAARDLTTPAGMTKAQFIAQLKQTFGPEYDVIPSKGNSVHVEPGPALGKRVRGGIADVPLPERDIQSPEGRRATFEDQYAVAKKRFAGLPDSGLDELAADYRKQISPEEQEKTKRFDEGVFMTTLGAALAGTEEQNFLSAVGKALAVATPGLAASKKERKEAERDARRGLREVLGLKRSEQKEVLEFAKDLQAIDMGAEMSELARKEAREAANLAFIRDKEMARLGHGYKIAELKAQGEITNTQFEQVAAQHRAKLITRIKQGLPIEAPDGTVIPVPPGGMAPSELDVLASNWALYDLNRYRSQNTGVDPLGGLKRGAGAGATGGGGVEDLGAM